MITSSGVKTFIKDLSLLYQMIDVSGNVFLQLGIITILAAVAAFFLRLIKQPQILAYVLVGILITPIFKVITNTSFIEAMSSIGIAFLLFTVGLEMDLKKLKNVALISSLGGAVQICVLFIIGYIISLLLGFVSLEAAYIGLMLCFSSTMVVMKLLSDKHELDTLHGRIIVGILLLEDIIAIFALSILTTLNGFSFSFLGIAVLKFLFMFALAFLASKFIFPLTFRFAAKNQELLLISSLAVCFVFSLAFYYLGFSIIIGAFIAGIALGNLEYNYEIIGNVRSLRDFFALMFFVSLGMAFSLSVITKLWLPLIVIMVVILLIKPFVTMLVCSLFKYTKKPSFLTAISLTQMGEFSLILASAGVTLDHISSELFSLVVIIVLFSITLTSYLIKYDDWLYNLFEKPLKIFDVFTTEGLEYLPTEVKPSIILCGHNRIGYSILQKMRDIKKKVLVIDFNPEIISLMVKEGYHCLYGNVADEEIIQKMNLENITLLISTVPEYEDNLLLLKKVRSVNRKAKVFLTANDIDDALKLYKSSADYVILPHFLGGEHVSHIINEHRNQKLDLKEEKDRHIRHLRERKRVGQEHPKHD